MDRCPNCRARREDADTCRRCGMELGTLLAVEEAAEALIVRAIDQLARDELPAATRTLANARTLHPDPFIGHLLAFARQFPEAPAHPAASPDQAASP